MFTSDKVIEFNKDGEIALIGLDRPDQLNAFDVGIRDQLYEAVLAVRDDPSVKAMVLYGKGRGFCAGADLNEFGTYPSVLQKRRIRLKIDLWEEIRSLSKPTAAVLHGFAVGSGLEMAMLCDFRFAEPDTRLALPEAQLGMIPAAGGTQSLPRLMKRGAALEFALTGRRITAEEGYKRNLITKVFPKERLMEGAIQYLRDIVQPAEDTASWIKTLVANGMDQSLANGIAQEEMLVARSWAEKRI